MNTSGSSSPILPNKSVLVEKSETLTEEEKEEATRRMEAMLTSSAVVVAYVEAAKKEMVNLILAERASERDDRDRAISEATRQFKNIKFFLQ